MGVYGDESTIFRSKQWGELGGDVPDALHPECIRSQSIGGVPSYWDCTMVRVSTSPLEVGLYNPPRSARAGRSRLERDLMALSNSKAPTLDTMVGREHAWYIPPGFVSLLQRPLPPAPLEGEGHSCLMKSKLAEEQRNHRWNNCLSHIMDLSARAIDSSQLCDGVCQLGGTYTPLVQGGALSCRQGFGQSQASRVPKEQVIVDTWSKLG